MLKYLIFMSAIFVTVYSQVVDYRDCPQTQPVQNFNITAFMGTWYESSSYWDRLQSGTKCNTAKYTLRDDGNIDVLNEDLRIALNQIQQRQGMANITGDGSEGRLYFSPSTGVAGEYLILGTDYTNWATVWMCDGIPSAVSVRYAWLWTRTRNPSQDVIDATVDALAKFGIQTDILIETNNENCTNV